VNGVIALILRIFTDFGCFAGLLANYVTVVEDRHIMSVNIVSSYHIISQTFPMARQSTRAHQRLT